MMKKLKNVINMIDELYYESQNTNDIDNLKSLINNLYCGVEYKSLIPTEEEILELIDKIYKKGSIWFKNELKTKINKLK